MVGINIGIDLGNVNSCVFVYDLDRGKPVSIVFDQGSPLLPSVVSYHTRDKLYSFGKTAKLQRHKRFQKFNNLKMLLPEKASVSITKRFIKYMLDEALNQAGAHYIQTLVIGYPEVWNDMEQSDACVVLQEICNDLLQEINEKIWEQTSIRIESCVQLRRESECVCASCIRQLQLTQVERYNGNILVINCGGITLDLTLLSVKETNDEPTVVDVLVQECGRENHMAICYMESVIETALRNQIEDFQGEQSISHDSKFYQAVNQLEGYLTGIEGKIRLKKIFDIYGVDEEMLSELGDVDYFNEGIFCYVEYGEDELYILYEMLAERYNTLIAPVIETHCKRMICQMIQRGIEYQNPMCSDLKIVIAGGFGQYYPVQKQIDRLFQINDVNDRRTILSWSSMGAELAVGYGACLLSVRDLTT